MLTGKTQIEDALAALAARLALDGSPPVELAVCGGAALIVQGLTTRVATKDVDAFAAVQKGQRGELRLVSCAQLSPALTRAIEAVAGQFGLGSDWLNGQATLALNEELPPGLTDRLHLVRYGPCLTLYFLDRLDQIYFKLYAAADHGPTSRHTEDLRALNPTAAEIRGAARWALSLHQPDDAFNQVELPNCLRYLGFEDVVERLQGPF